jgi:hypothetical protein
LTKIVVCCSVAIETFRAFELHPVWDDLMRPFAMPFPLDETGSHPTIGWAVSAGRADDDF